MDGGAKPRRGSERPMTSLSARSRAKRKKRTYNLRLIRRNLSYSISEIADLFATHPQTVRQWIKAGLETIDGRRPFLVHGGELIRFLSERQSRRKHQCRPEQFFCCRCRTPKRLRNGLVTIRILNERQLCLAGHCQDCDSPMNRVGSVRCLEEYRRIFIIETIAKPRLEEDAHPCLRHHLEGSTGDEAFQPKE
jgi:hypothetical protein